MSDTCLQVKARLILRDEIAMGPGKADLLEAIGRCGSISAAARELGMSYRRAWLLVDTMNRCFRDPLVAAAVGGRHGGGAALTLYGAEVLGAYRALEKSMARAAEKHVRSLSERLRS